MSGILHSTTTRRQRVISRLIVAALAILLIAGICALIAWLLWPTPIRPPQKIPFGLAREAAAPTSGFGSLILNMQGHFYKALETSILALKENGTALWPLLDIGFAYGVFHAAGPGHGKGVISAYLVANERSLFKGLAVCLAAALLQAVVAVSLVSILAVMLRVTAATMNSLTNIIEIASFAIVTLLGLLMSWRKAGKLIAVVDVNRGIRPDPADLLCDHVHLPPPDEIDRIGKWRDLAGVVLAAGTRPCSGALIMLVFALSQGLFASGVLATLAMALGTAITTSIIAMLAVFAKNLALRLAGGRSSASAAIGIAVLELTAAAFVAVLGLSLMTGLWIEIGST